MSCRFNDRELADEAYAEENLNSPIDIRLTEVGLQCAHCDRFDCPSLEFNKILGRHPLCPNQSSCRLTER